MFKAEFLRTGSIRRRRFWVYPLLLTCVPAGARAANMCPNFANQALAAQLAAHPVAGIHAQADRVSMMQGGISHLQGNARVRQLDRLLEADELFYNQRTDTAYTPGRAYFQSPRIGVHGRNARYQLHASKGSIDDAHYTLPKRNARGTARRVNMKSANITELRGATYTTCPPGHTNWLLSGSRVWLNQKADEGTALNALLRFKGIPIFYSPFLTFPISNRRKSGFLIPTIGGSSNSGFQFSIPYYLNLAPNFDATLGAHYMARRGFQAQGEFRYLEPHASGKLYLEYLPHDSLYGSPRYLVKFNHAQRLSQDWSVNASYERVSDSSYFQDGLTTLGAYNTSSLSRELRFNYQAPQWLSFEALAQGYQILPKIPGRYRPYNRLPQLSLDLLSPGTWHGLGLDVQTQYVNFTRSGGLTGQRVNLRPAVTYQLDHGGWFVHGQADYDETRYSLRNVTPGEPTTPSRGLPSASLKAGLRFDRNWGSKWVQTLEPTLFYLYRPYRNQSNLPVFDSGLPEFNYYSLFARNRFTGLDRLSDANQLTAVLTTRLIDANTGQEKASASIGQIQRFTRPRVALPSSLINALYSGSSLQDRSHSDWVGLFSYNITNAWGLGASIEWDPYSKHVTRDVLHLGYHSRANGRHLDISYRYDRLLLEQAQVSAVLPVSRHWRFRGSWDYSLHYDHTFDESAGVEYNTCCYALSLLYRRYVVAPPAGQTGITQDTGIFFQLRLKGLASLGQRL